MRRHRFVDSLNPCGPHGGRGTDAEFFRRCSSDLIGCIPTRDEVPAFLTDTFANKRAQAVERMLESAEFNRFFANVLDVMLMERRRGNRVSTDQWREYLVESLATRKSYDQIAREILSADGTGQHREAAKFYLDRDVEAHVLTRDVGRMFLGRDLQCAQCA